MHKSIGFSAAENFAKKNYEMECCTIRLLTDNSFQIEHCGYVIAHDKMQRMKRRLALKKAKTMAKARGFRKWIIVDGCDIIKRPNAEDHRMIPMFCEIDPPNLTDRRAGKPVDENQVRPESGSAASQLLDSGL